MSNNKLSVEDVLKDNAERTKDATKETLRHAVIEDGWQIFNRKGNTCYGIAAATTAILKSILFNENRIYPVSVHLDGQYGMNDIFLSVPTIIDKTGAKEIGEINTKIIHKFNKVETLEHMKALGLQIKKLFQLKNFTTMVTARILYTYRLPYENIEEGDETEVAN